MTSNFADEDIIGGQEKGADLHPGNVMFRKQTCAQAPNGDQQKISKRIAAALRRFGFKFSKGDKKASKALVWSISSMEGIRPRG
jgi:hypothetical protein